LPARAFGLSETARISISGQTITQLSRVSASGNCVGLEVEVARTGTYQRRGQVTGNTFQVDTLIESIRVKPLTALGAQVLNLAGWCGISDWAVNQEKDVTAKTGSERCFAKQPATTYSVYSVEGNRLYFGRGEETTQPARRPVELNREEYYIRR
jgi:hypothetical protein